MIAQINKQDFTENKPITSSPLVGEGDGEGDDIR